MEWTPIIVELDTNPSNSHEIFKNIIVEILNEFGDGSIKSKSDINTQSKETIFLIYVNSDIENDIKEFLDESQYVKRSKVIDNMLANYKTPLESEDLLAIFFDKNKHVGMVCKNYKCKTVIANAGTNHE
jgi:hypothetical protein